MRSELSTLIGQEEMEQRVGWGGVGWGTGPDRSRKGVGGALVARQSGHSCYIASFHLDVHDPEVNLIPGFSQDQSLSIWAIKFWSLMGLLHGTCYRRR